MITVEIPIETTWAPSTSYIPIPNEYPAIESIPTTQYLQGVNGIMKAMVRKSKSRSVQIKQEALKDNILKLHYEEISPLSRYAGLAERP